MKTTTKAMVATAVLLTAALVAEPAFAWGRSHVRVGVGFYFGVPLAGFPYYYPPYYHYYPPYYPAPVVVQTQPAVYLEHSPVQFAPQPAQHYWYYCADSRAYYPYVKDCPGGWQRVSPQPQG